MVIVILTETLSGKVMTFDNVSGALDYALELIKKEIQFKTTYDTRLK